VRRGGFAGGEPGYPTTPMRGRAGGLVAAGATVAVALAAAVPALLAAAPAGAAAQTITISTTNGTSTAASVVVVAAGQAASVGVELVTSDGAPSGAPVAVAFSEGTTIVSGTATVAVALPSTAVAGTDYTQTSGTVTFAAGSRSGTVEEIIVDTIAAAAPALAKTINVTLSAPATSAEPVTVADDPATVVIDAHGYPYLDPSLPIARRVANLLSLMTPGEKVGQMAMADRTQFTSTASGSATGIDAVRAWQVGAALSGGGDVPTPNTPEGWADMIDGYEYEALATPLQIPILYGEDTVHGDGNMIGATVFPHNVGIGATRDPALAAQEGAVTAAETRASGPQWGFSPCVCVAQDERWGRTYESFGQDPALVSLMEAEIDGLQGTNPTGLPTLAAALTRGRSYTRLSVSPLPGAIAPGDPLAIADPATAASPTRQLVRAAAPAGAGATSVTVTRFVAGYSYPAGSTLEDRRHPAGSSAAASLAATDHILATAKHYAGDGGTSYGTGDSGYPLDQGVDVMSSANFASQLLAPYAPVVQRHEVGAIMPSFSSTQLNGARCPTKMSANHQLLTDELKHTIGFQGILISDWNAITQIGDRARNSCPNPSPLPAGIANTYSYQVAASANAGMHMFMVPSSYVVLEQDLITLVTGRPLLSASIAAGATVTSLGVAPLPAAVAAGDRLELANGSSTQIVTAAATAPQGAPSVAVTAFVANANYTANAASLGDATHAFPAPSVPMSRVNDAVRRILTAKFETGLFDHPFTNRSAASSVGDAADRAVAARAVSESQVLLKNSANLLPLAPSAHLYVAGSNADNLGSQTGGWTLGWQGAAGAIADPGTTILHAIEADDPNVTYGGAAASAPAPAAGAYDAGIVVVGEHPYAEGEGDVGDRTPTSNGEISSLNLSASDQAAVNAVCRAMKCVVLVVSGRPMTLSAQLREITALVASWLPGTEGEGVAADLFGEQPFSGQLPQSWPASLAQLPLDVTGQHSSVYDPQFPFGWGLRTGPSSRADLQATAAALASTASASGDHAVASAAAQLEAIVHARVWNASGAVGQPTAVLAGLRRAALSLQWALASSFPQAGGAYRDEDGLVSVARDLAQAAIVRAGGPRAATSRLFADADDELLRGQPARAVSLLAQAWAKAA
jgi:beta-glucosidase-like glycosyl hydrolase